MNYGAPRCAGSFTQAASADCVSDREIFRVIVTGDEEFIVVTAGENTPMIYGRIDTMRR